MTNFDLTDDVPGPVPLRFRSIRTITALILREIATSYGKSAIGYLWAFIEPVVGIILLTFIFSMMSRNPPVGTSYPYFYATGMLVFFLYGDIAGKISSALGYSRALLFYPGVTFIEAIIARLILNGLTQMIVFFVILASIIQIYDLDVILDYIEIMNALCMATVFGLGIGVMNCFLNSVFPTWTRIWAITNRPMFFISCIFYTYESVPIPYNEWLWYNPLVHIIGKMRMGAFPTYDGAYVSPLYVYSIGFGLLALGLVMLGRYKSFILNDG